MPVRAEFSRLASKSDARESLRLDVDRFTVLIVGGSQGARGVNELALEMWPLVDDGSTQALHQVGERNLEDIRARTGEKAVFGDYHVEGFVEMSTALAAADLVIARSGASTLAEITSAGVPAILIPYPYAYADHQRLNAEAVAATGAAIVCDEASLKAETLADRVRELRGDSEKLGAMSKAASGIGHLGAAAKVAKTLLNPEAV